MSYRQFHVGMSLNVNIELILVASQNARMSSLIKLNNTQKRLVAAVLERKDIPQSSLRALSKKFNVPRTRCSVHVTQMGPRKPFSV